VFDLRTIAVAMRIARILPEWVRQAEAALHDDGHIVRRDDQIVFIPKA